MHIFRISISYLTFEVVLQKVKLEPVADWDAKKTAYLAIQQKHERMKHKQSKVSLSPIHGAAVLNKDEFREATAVRLRFAYRLGFCFITAFLMSG